MVRGSYQGLIELTDEEREELMRWSRSRSLPAGDVFKATLILALANGKSYSDIEVELNISRPTIARWKARFEESRIVGLEGRHIGSIRIIPSPQSPSAGITLISPVESK
jgi:hypothetical protein